MWCNKCETCAEINLVFGSHWILELILVSWPANGRPRWKKSSFKILLLQANFHSNCAFQIFLRTKWHVLQLLQTRFSIYPIFHHKNQENWFFSMEYFFELKMNWPAIGRPMAGQHTKKNFDQSSPANGRPTCFGDQKIFSEEKNVFWENNVEISAYMLPNCIFCIFQMICDPPETYLMLKSTFCEFPAAVLCWVPLFQKWL